MPLLGKKPYSFASIPDDIKQTEEVFVIKKTNEVFKSYKDYIDKILLYSSQVWSCQYTGQSQLSFDEALESEQNALKSLKNFPKCFEKSILKIAHHWTSGLDALVEKCYKDIHSSFNEKDVRSKVHSEHVIEVHSEDKDLSPSPQSDKENLKDNKSKLSSKKLHDAHRKETGECLKNVKSDNISHMEKCVKKCPTKELITLFIRANLSHPVGKTGQTAFVLKRDVQNKYSIPDKLKEFSVNKKNVNSEPLSTIQHVNNSKPKKTTEKTKKCSPEKSTSDSKNKAKKLDPLQRSLDFFRVKQTNNEDPKSPEKTTEEEPSSVKKVSSTPTKRTKEALVILDKFPRISPVKVKCNGDKITIESLSSSGESDDNDNKTFEIKSKKFRFTPKMKGKTNAFSLLKSPPKSGAKTAESSMKKKASNKQKKERKEETENKNEGEIIKEMKEKKENKNEDIISNSSIKAGSTEDCSELIQVDASPSKPSTNAPEKKKTTEKSKKVNKSGNQNDKSLEKKPDTKSKVRTKNAVSSKESKKSPVTIGAKKSLNKSSSEEATKSKEEDSGCVVIVEDSQDILDPETEKPSSSVSKSTIDSEVKEMEKSSTPKMVENHKKKQKTLSEMFNAALQRDKPLSLTRVINKAIVQNISSPSVLDLTTPAKERIRDKWEQIREKQKWKFLSAEEKQKIKEERKKKRREELLKQKQEKLEQQRKEMLKRLEETKKIEDTELELKPLPEGKVIGIPVELTIECFADVVMIVEFITCYKDLLVPEEKFNLTAESLMKALVTGDKGSNVLSSLLVILLQILLQNLQGQKKSCHSYFGSKLSDMPLTQHSAPELARLYLNAMLSSSSKRNQLERQEERQMLLDIIKSMEEKEFFALMPQDKLKLLVALCHAVMSSDAIDNYIEAKIEEGLEIRRQKKAEEKEIRAKLKEEKERKEQMKKKELEEQQKLQASTAEGSQNTSSTAEEKTIEGTSVKQTSIVAALTGDNKNKQNEKKNENEKGDTSTEDQEKTNEVSPSEIAQTIKNRRLRLELNKQEIEKKQVEDRERRIKEEEERRKEQNEQIRLATIAKLKQALRTTPLGYDRYHRRYWLFAGMAGLYVEDGWMPLYGTSVTHMNNSEESVTNTKENGTAAEEGVTNNGENVSDGYGTNNGNATNNNGNATNNNGNATNNNGNVNNEENTDQDVMVVSEESLQKIDDNTSTENNQENNETLLDKSFRDVPYSWTYYDNIDDIKALLDGLAPRGIRESALHEVLTAETTAITKNIKKGVNSSDKPAQNEGTEEMLAYLKQDLLDTADRVTRGNLGEIENMEKYQKNLEKAAKLGPYLIKLQESILKRFLKDNFTEEAVNQWRQSVMEASTISRLHLLLEILDSAIVWDKSAENAKCKVCRKKGSDNELLLLCDECNRGYHLHCLRPALNKIPEGEWKCPSCEPVCSARSQRNRKELSKDDSSDDDDEDSDESEEDAENEDYCNICQEGGDELVCCDTCPLVFHKDCHDPPLRNTPRGTWSCMECKRPKPIKTRKQQSSKQPGKSVKINQCQKNVPNTRKRKMSCDESSNDSFEASTRNRRTARKRQLDISDESDEECNKKRRVTRKKASIEEESEEEDSEEEEEGEGESGEDEEDESGEDEEDESEEEEEEEEEKVEEKPQRNTRSNKRSEPKPKAVTSQREKRKATSQPAKDVSNTGPSKRRRTNPELEICEMILIELLRSEDSWPFLVPVNIKEVPDYFNFVSDPMDFKTIKEKLEWLQYSDAEPFVKDMQLVFENCDKYNSITSEIGQTGYRLAKVFQKLLKEHLPQFVMKTRRTGRRR